MEGVLLEVDRCVRTSFWCCWTSHWPVESYIFEAASHDGYQLDCLFIP